jgi:hypothetical protein
VSVERNLDGYYDESGSVITELLADYESYTDYENIVDHNGHAIWGRPGSEKMVYPDHVRDLRRDGCKS